MYNEESRVEKTVKALDGFIPSITTVVDVVFVNDGSTDQTLEKLKELSPKFKFRVENYPLNQGKGHALKTGILKATGDYVLFMDADMSTPIEELLKFLPLIEQKIPVIIGSRKTKGANVIKHQNPWRQKLGEGFTLLSNLILLSRISDFTCGFKAFRNDAAKKVFTAQKIKRWGYDSEILFLASKYSYEIKEVPVTWSNDERTRVNLLKDVWRSFTDLIKIRYYDVTNKY